jgi:alpha-tubulin suppressor-like RCC1 family protein
LGLAIFEESLLSTYDWRMISSLFESSALHYRLLHVCRVHQVSCGPFHAAAISDDGCLYTWAPSFYLAIS